MKIVNVYRQLKDVEPGSLVFFGGNYYIKSDRVYTDRDNQVMISCCNVRTGVLNNVNASCDCSVYENAMIRLGE